MTSTTTEHTSWTAAGSDATAQNTYASIRKALEPIERAKGLDVYLQGSYANATNIRADSDVDVVAQSDNTFYSNKERLSSIALERYKATYSTATYLSADLRRDVKAALVAYYGAARVRDRDKCLTVTKTAGYVDADVVPGFQYRHYRTSDPANLAQDFAEGIMIHPLSGDSIINFPKEHRSNGESKNAACSGRYKQTVRQVKRLRNRAALEGLTTKKEAPGYLLECMVFNAPTDRFVSNDSERLKSVILWLKHANKSTFSSCDRIHTLFGTDPGGFDVSAAQRVIDALWVAY